VLRLHATPIKPINLTERFQTSSEHWSPKIIAQTNDYQFKLVKFKGEFVWHDHRDTDEVFIVLEGAMTIHFRDGDASVRAGELFVVPKWTEHKTSAESECKAMLVEMAGTVNTGKWLTGKPHRTTPGSSASMQPTFPQGGGPLSPDVWPICSSHPVIDNTEELHTMLGQTIKGAARW